MSSMRKVVEDMPAKKFYQILENCSNELTLIKDTFNNFIETKRSQYYRFYFLTNQ